jgi:hypothetical protein
VFKLASWFALVALIPVSALAQTPASPAPEPTPESAEISPGEGTLITGDALAGLLLGKPQSSLFGPGGSVSAGVYRSMGPALLLGLRLRGAAFLNKDGEDPSRVDPGVGGLGSLTLAFRVRPMADAGRATRARGPWLELTAGGGLTGDLFRPVIEGGIGWGFATGVMVMGPALRYLHVIQSGEGQDGRDGKAVLLGIEMTLGDPQPLPPLPPPPAPPEGPKDTDGDGILDPDDKCPTEPEDKDNFEDEDGCPDTDNDKDGIADYDVACPDLAEVVSGVDD